MTGQFGEGFEGNVSITNRAETVSGFAQQRGLVLIKASATCPSQQSQEGSNLLDFHSHPVNGFQPISVLHAIHGPFNAFLRNATYCFCNRFFAPKTKSLTAY